MHLKLRGGDTFGPFIDCG